MSIRDYWQQGATAYQAFRRQQKLEQLDAELHTLIAKLSRYPCTCEKVDAHHCYADKHDTMEIDDNKFCRCRCHKTDEF
jgi:hypothetical protein